jgi:2-polyprenyl-3-methyl-5-hydroxy-6-metoxy-1,4-benzoquinol methylase
MAVLLDPEGAEVAVLHDMVNLQDQTVLEIGCGDGRLTRRLAQEAAHVTGIDPDPQQITLAKENCPYNLNSKVDFEASSLQDFSVHAKGNTFDTVIFSWSL